MTKLIQETADDIQYLESISNALDIALNEADLAQIKEELMQSGYIRRKHTKKKVKLTSKPMHYISSDGYDMYVGKNNLQNEELTFFFLPMAMTGGSMQKVLRDLTLSSKAAGMNFRTVPLKKQVVWPLTTLKTVEQTKWRSTISRKNMSRSRTGQSRDSLFTIQTILWSLTPIFQI